MLRCSPGRRATARRRGSPEGRHRTGAATERAAGGGHGPRRSRRSAYPGGSVASPPCLRRDACAVSRRGFEPAAQRRVPPHRRRVSASCRALRRGRLAAASGSPVVGIEMPDTALIVKCQKILRIDLRELPGLRRSDASLTDAIQRRAEREEHVVADRGLQDLRPRGAIVTLKADDGASGYPKRLCALLDGVIVPVARLAEQCTTPLVGRRSRLSRLTGRSTHRCKGAAPARIRQAPRRRSCLPSKISIDTKKAGQ